MARKKQKHLKSGFTTGTAAAAAAKCALIHLLDGRPPDRVRVTFLTGDTIVIPVHRAEMLDPDMVSCSVIKDAGDDPDVTNHAEIGARVSIKEETGDTQDGFQLVIQGGEGVGRVTKPGLEVPPGKPAINPGPETMIRREIREVLAQKKKNNVKLRVEIFVPRGKEIASKTMNQRLGILGGISILGTTGIVKPMSHEAYVATIESALSVAAATGQKWVVLTTGRRSERYAQQAFQEIPEEAFVQMGDFFKKTLNAASGFGFEKIILAAFFGKAVKMAQGAPHTHALKSSLSLKELAAWIREKTGDRRLSDQITGANTARHAFDMIHAKNPEAITLVGERMVAAGKTFTKPGIDIQALILDYQGNIVYNSEGYDRMGTS